MLTVFIYEKSISNRSEQMEVLHKIDLLFYLYDKCINSPQKMNRTTTTQTSPSSKMFTYCFPDGREVYSKGTAEKLAMHINNVEYEDNFTDNICNNQCCSSMEKRQIFDSKTARACHSLNCTIKKENPQTYEFIQDYLKTNVKVSRREEAVKRSPMKKQISTINGGGVSRPLVAPVVSPFVSPSVSHAEDSLDIDSPNYLDSVEEMGSHCVEEYVEKLEELNGEFQNRERCIIRYQMNKLDPLGSDYEKQSKKIREPFLENINYMETDRHFRGFVFEAHGPDVQYNDSIDIYSPTAIEEIREISANLKNEYEERVDKINKELDDKRRVIIRREIAKLDPMNDDYEKRIAEIRENILNIDMF